MLVENKEARVLGMPPINQKGEPLVLKPGFNEVDDAHWEAARKSKFVRQRLGKELVEHAKPQPKPAPDPAANVDAGPKAEGEGLGGMSAVKALEVIKGTFDMQLLDKWAGADTRKKVKDAIKKQVRLLNEGRKKDEESDEG